MRRDELGIGFLFDYVRDAIVVADATSGRIVLWNQAAESMFGYSADEAVGQLVDILIPEPFRERHRAGLQRYVATGHGPWIDSREAVELPALRKDGAELIIELSLGSVRHPDPTRVFVVATIRDVTHRKELEERLSQAERLEGIGLLAGGVAHDFNNVLQAIIGFSDLTLARLEPEDSRLLPLIQEISKAGERGAAITRQLLAFGQRQRLVSTAFDLNLVVTDLEPALQALVGERVRLVLALDAEVGPIEADTSQIAQAIENLSQNAVDAMPQGGVLVIETHNVELDEAAVQGWEPMSPGPYVSLVVRDTGEGMDRETIAHIFEPFFTTKAQGKGTGLGLASVYGIVKQSRGYVWAESSPGRGTTFSIFFPRSDAELSLEIPDQMHPAGAAAGTILVVDDESAVVDLARAVLVDSGYAVLVAGRGDSAVRVSEEHSGPIHLLVTDVLMPGMSGPELADRLRSQRAELKVLYMTGYSARMLENRGALTADEVLQKPFSPDDLVERVGSVLAAGSTN